MLNIPVAVQDLFKTDGVPKNFRVHFPNGERADITNDMIVNGSVKFTESVCSKDVLQFGLAEASQIEFECVGVENIYGMTIQCAIEIEVGAEVQDDPDIDDTLSWLTPQYVVYSGVKYYRIPYGEFVVESCPRKQGAMKHRRVQAYGSTALDDIDISSLTNRFMPYKSLLISDKMIDCILDNTNFEVVNHSVSPYSQVIGEFHDNKGRYITIVIPGSSTCSLSANGRYADAVYIDYDCEHLDVMESNGMAFVQAVNNAGLNLCYNNKKAKIYENNEQAIRAMMPALFAPIIRCRDVSGYIEPWHIDKIWDYSFIPPNKSICYLESAGAYNKGIIAELPFTVGNTPRDSKSFSFFSPTGNTATARIEIYQSDSSDSSTESTISFQVSNPNVVVNSIKTYYVPDENADYHIKLNPTLVVKKKFHTALDQKNTFDPDVYKYESNKILSGYMYTNSISVNSIIRGFYELQAKFGRNGRSGSIESIGLSKENPITLSKSDYSEMWWDEYSVDSIGSVLYSFGRDNEQYEYVFGDGQSVYEDRKSVV